MRSKKAAVFCFSSQGLCWIWSELKVYKLFIFSNGDKLLQLCSFVIEFCHNCYYFYSFCVILCRHSKRLLFFSWSILWWGHQGFIRGSSYWSLMLHFIIVSQTVPKFLQQENSPLAVRAWGPTWTLSVVLGLPVTPHSEASRQLLPLNSHASPWGESASTLSRTKVPGVHKVRLAQVCEFAYCHIALLW